MPRCLVVPVQQTQGPWGVATMGNNDPASMKPFCHGLQPPVQYSHVFLSLLYRKIHLSTGGPQFTSPHVDLPPLTLRSVHDNDTIQFQLSLTFLSLDTCYTKQQTPASSSILLLPGLAGSTEIAWGFHCLAFLWHFYSSSLSIWDGIRLKFD